MNKNVQRAFIHNSQKLETAQIFINRKQHILLYSHNGILLSLKMNKLLIHAIIWIDLKIILLNQSNQADYDRIFIKS